MDQSHAALLGLSFSLSLRVAFDSSVWLGYGCKNSILWLILLLEFLKICLSIDFLYSINVVQSHLVNKVLCNVVYHFVFAHGNYWFSSIHIFTFKTLIQWKLIWPSWFQNCRHLPFCTYFLFQNPFVLLFDKCIFCTSIRVKGNKVVVYLP